MTEKEKQRKEIYNDLEFFLSHYKELSPRFGILDEVIEDLAKELKQLKE